MLRGALTARTVADVRVMTAIRSERRGAVHQAARGAPSGRGLIVLAGGISQPYVTTDYPAVQRGWNSTPTRCS
jgi:uridylate kinase